MRLFAFTVLLGCLPVAALGVERFPPPDFTESQHELPVTTTPPPRADAYQYLDVAVLAAALTAASYLALKRRSRRGLFVLMLFSLAYVGFYRKGCVCSIGSIQNVTYAAVRSGYAVPAFVLAFFLLPLVFTLFFGRTFCAGVCPLGAVQDVVLLRPVRVPDWLEHSLGLLAYVYLAAAVLLAATGSAFIICQYDPFVSLFRLSGNFNMLILGGCVLLIAIFVGRPYCRYLCPYGVLLRWSSRLSKWHVKITPDECIKCRLCEDACPFTAIRQPTPEQVAHARGEGKTRLALLSLLLPVWIVLGGLLGWGASGALSRTHATVRLAERIQMEDKGFVEGTTDASAAFRGTGRAKEELFAEVQNLRRRFVLGGWALGGFVGLLVGLKLIRLSVRRRRSDFEPDRATCLSCGRCFSYCPRERLRLKKAKGEPANT
jgi:NosR/NirI family nitrous oxide reductase transcriptional regulator